MASNVYYTTTLLHIEPETFNFDPIHGNCCYFAVHFIVGTVSVEFINICTIHTCIFIQYNHVMFAMHTIIKLPCILSNTYSERCCSK